MAPRVSKHPAPAPNSPPTHVTPAVARRGRELERAIARVRTEAAQDPAIVALLEKHKRELDELQKPYRVRLDKLDRELQNFTADTLEEFDMLSGDGFDPRSRVIIRKQTNQPAAAAAQPKE